jgi:hypothetical protein
MTQWKDATRYHQGEIRGVKPIDSWSIKSGKIQIWVSNAHRMHPDAWVCTCYQLHIDAQPLRLKAGAPVKEAKARAHALVGDTIADLRNDFLKISEE